MRRKYRTRLLAIALSAALLTACGAERGPSAPRSDAGSRSAGASKSGEPGGGWESLPIDTVDLSGAPVTDAQFLQNELTVFNVWGTWCPPCVGELPELQRLSEAFAERGVQIVGVLQDGVTETGEPSDRDIANALKLLESAGASYTVILPDETLTSAFISQMQFFPTTFFVDREGAVVHTVVGAKDFEAWSDEIDAIVEQIS